MSLKSSLTTLRAPWVELIARELSSGEGVRTGFSEQLERFYDLLTHAVLSGDVAWLDPILYDWGHAPTETNLDEGGYFVSFVLNRMITLTIQIARENLPLNDALELLAVIVPVYTHSLSVVIRYEMEARVAHITSELGKTQEKLQQLDRNKSNFISVAAHELKTPLTLIEGYTAMMADSVSQSGQSQTQILLQGVNTGIHRLRHIIDDMIDVSLIDNNLLNLNFQPLWIKNLLELLKSELGHAISERKQTLTIHHFDGDDLMIYGDSERIYQALFNVTSNAIKFTPDHGTVTINGRLLPGFIEISVSDTGIGISPENQAVIFEKFGQLGRTDLHSSGRTKFKGGGPGLGLPITKGIIEAHGGTIWVESEGYDEVQLKGSTFHILLPTLKEASDPKIAMLFSKYSQLTKNSKESRSSG